MKDRKPAKQKKTPKSKDPVIEADEESFPASDPPAWTGVHAGEPDQVPDGDRAIAGRRKIRRRRG